MDSSAYRGIEKAFLAMAIFFGLLIGIGFIVLWELGKFLFSYFWG